MSEPGRDMMSVRVLQAHAERLTTETAAPGLVLCVRSPTGLLATAVTGMADHECPVVAETAFRAASVTKALVGMLVLRLRDQGALDLDDVVDAVLPEIAHRRVTWRRLLTHQAGLPLDSPTTSWREGSFPSEDVMLRSVPAVFDRRRVGYHYSNLGYGLIGAALQRLTGRDWGHLLHVHVLAPLALTGTTLTAPERHASGWSSHQASVAEPVYLADMRAISPAGQLWMTASDLAIVAQICVTASDEGFLSEVGALELTHPHALADRRWERAAGLGPSIYRLGGRLSLGAHGLFPGGQAAAVADPGTRHSVSVLVNHSDALDARALALDLLAELVDAESGRGDD